MRSIDCLERRESSAVPRPPRVFLLYRVCYCKRWRRGPLRAQLVGEESNRGLSRSATLLLPPCPACWAFQGAPGPFGRSRAAPGGPDTARREEEPLPPKPRGARPAPASPSRPWSFPPRAHPLRGFCSDWATPLAPPRCHPLAQGPGPTPQAPLPQLLPPEVDEAVPTSRDSAPSSVRLSRAQDRNPRAPRTQDYVAGVSATKPVQRTPPLRANWTPVFGNVIGPLACRSRNASKQGRLRPGEELG